MSVGTQSTVSTAVINTYPGRIISTRRQATQGSNTYSAGEFLLLGSAVFLGIDGNTVYNNVATSGATTKPLGFLISLEGNAPISYQDTATGYATGVATGYGASICITGDIAEIVTGVDATGKANHVPVAGENIWIANAVTVGGANIVSAPASITAVTGYTQMPSAYVAKIGLNTTATVSANQSCCIVSVN